MAPRPCSYALLRLLARSGAGGGYGDIEDLKHAIAEARILDHLIAGKAAAGGSVDASDAKGADLPSLFSRAAFTGMGGPHSLLMSERPSRVLFPLRSHFLPAAGMLLTVDPSWREAEQARLARAARERPEEPRRSFIDSDHPELVLQLSLRRTPSNGEEKHRRCYLTSAQRPRRERGAFRRYVSFRAQVVDCRNGMSPQWLASYAADVGRALAAQGGSMRGGDPADPRSARLVGTVRTGEFGKPISLHIGLLTDEQTCGAGAGFYAVLTAKKPSTLGKANQLQHHGDSSPLLLPNGKRRRISWPQELEQLTMLPLPQ